MAQGILWEVASATPWSTKGAPARSFGLDSAPVPTIEARLEEALRLPAPETLGLAVQEHLRTGGKRIRARLAWACVRALGGSDEAALWWAAACELLHNATLVHDDVQDGDRLRRGQPTVWARHGLAEAINVGDWMIVMPTLLVERVPVDDGRRWRLARALQRAAANAVRGQSLEQTLNQLRGSEEDLYREVLLGKTGALLALPVEGAAIIGGVSARITERLQGLFLKAGLLFQLQDDVLDCFGSKGREAIGSDIREGKVSALVVAHLRRCPEETLRWRELLTRSREETTQEDVAWAIERFRCGGALRDVVAEIRTLRASLERDEVWAQVPALAPIAAELVTMTCAPIEHVLGEEEKTWNVA